MATFRIKYDRIIDEDGTEFNSITPQQYSHFSSGILDLGSVDADAKITNALAAIFDLEGFTDFCNQIDPQLVVPEFLARFFDWLFDAIKAQFTKHATDENVTLWSGLPFFGKFTGDGALFLFDIESFPGPMGIGNSAVCLRNICNDYKKSFYPSLLSDFSKPPGRLRVGIARGHVLSIGEDKDFVGPCINMAARLQKVASLSFAMSRRGFDLNRHFGTNVGSKLIKKRFAIRGVGTAEPIYVIREEFDELSEEEKSLFS